MHNYIIKKGQKVSSMHDCIQFDVYLSDPHYTEKEADGDGFVYQPIKVTELVKNIASQLDVFYN